MINPTTICSSGPEEVSAFQELLENHLALVRAIVERMKRKLPSNVETEDLYSIGLTGLVAAARNYRRSQERTFAAYAAIRISGAILDELRRTDWLSRAADRKPGVSVQPCPSWNKNKVEASAKTLSAPKCK